MSALVKLGFAGNAAMLGWKRPSSEPADAKGQGGVTLSWSHSIPCAALAMMEHELFALLGMKLDDVAKTPFVQPLMKDSVTELIGEEFYLCIRPFGIAFVGSFDGRVTAIQLFSEGYQHYQQFAGTLPSGINFRDSRQATLVRLGEQSASGGGIEIQFFGMAPQWACYDRKIFLLHIQYAIGEEAITLVSLLHPDSIPR